MKIKKLCLSIALALFLTSCAKQSENQIAPLMQLEWFTEIDNVKTQLNGYELLEERQNSDGTAQQDLLDYTGTELFEVDCDLTVCCTSQGLVGLNYHDIEKTNNYHEWYENLITIYGVPTESGNGMASWYDNPVGKSTALYLFNLEEGVQISFYATSSTPDKSYTGQDKEIFVPTPELRTPVIPVADDSESDTTGNAENIANTENDITVLETIETNKGVQTSDNTQSEKTDDIHTADNQENSTGNLKQTAVTTKAANITDKTTTNSATTDIHATEETQSEANRFNQNNLEFYASPESEREKLSEYTQLYEYKTEESGQPWELIMEYKNIPYGKKTCDTVLCFTSLGLIGINYLDSDSTAYSEWISDLTEVYGAPTGSQQDYTVWDNNPLGDGTMIYIFELEDGIQISLFADDTGSELS